MSWKIVKREIKERVRAKVKITNLELQPLKMALMA